MIDWDYIIRKWLLRQKTWHYLEKRVKYALSQIDGDTFIDIGANVGNYSLMLRNNFKHIISIEPNHKFVVELNRRIVDREISNIQVIEIALSEKTGKIPFFPSGENRGSADTIMQNVTFRPSDSRLDRTFRGGNHHLVVTDTFDNYFSGMIIDLVKMDVELAEFLILQGATKSLRNGTVKRWCIELHDRDRKTALEQILEGYGYRYRWIDPDHIFAHRGDS
jgi:FkbM family methyltransferase